jgi:hypothetical protein
MGQAISYILQGGGTALSSISYAEEGHEANKMGKLQQQQYNAEAEAVRISGRDEGSVKREEAERFKTSQIANISANRGAISGSNLILVMDSARNFELDALTIERNYMTQAGKLVQAGHLVRYEGQMAQKAGRMKSWSNALGSAGQAGSQYYAYKNLSKEGGTGTGFTKTTKRTGEYQEQTW